MLVSNPPPDIEYQAVQRWFAVCEGQTIGPFEAAAQAWSYIEAQLRSGYVRDVWDVVTE